MSLEDRIVFGGLYKAKNVKKVWENYTSSSFDGNNQRYDLWIPIRFTGSDTVKPGIYMIDTYQLDRIYGDYDAIVNKLVSYGENGNDPYYRSHNYYYRSRIRLTEEILDEFELVADLKEWHQVEGSVSCEYIDSDRLCYVHLFHEHNYPSGISLVRNNATVNPWNKIEVLCDKIMRFTRPDIPYDCIRAKSELDEYLEHLGDDTEYNVERVQEVLKVYEVMGKLSKEYETYHDLINKAHDSIKYEWRDIEE